jgi:hypothetical protein
MTDLPALREAVARLQSVQCTPEIDPGVRGWIEDGKLVADALPALLADLAAARADCVAWEQRYHEANAEGRVLLADLAAERIENAHLRQAFVTMEKAYNAAVAP